MTPSRQPDADEIVRSMLLLHGVHDDGHTIDAEDEVLSWAKAPDFADDPDRAAAVHEATRRDRERYLTSGLAEVACRFCHAAVQVKKLGAPHTAVQWNSDAQQQCAVFAEVRATGGDSARVPSCPRLTDSISHAIAEGCLEEYSSAPAPGDG